VFGTLSLNLGVFRLHVFYVTPANYRLPQFSCCSHNLGYYQDEGSTEEFKNNDVPKPNCLHDPAPVGRSRSLWSGSRHLQVGNGSFHCEGGSFCFRARYVPANQSISPILVPRPTPISSSRTSRTSLTHSSLVDLHHAQATMPLRNAEI
jgi:hypothetical protein